ncbi:MAG: glycine cleavage system aminomethyltransferase GcvT [Planctomycetota bacterium]
MKKTVLFEWHKGKGQMVPFGGYLMPVVYSSIKNESIAVRTYCGVFDVSHMGKIKIGGERFLEFGNCIFPMDVKNAKDYKALYGYLLNEDGGIIDDLIVYKFPSYLLCVVNASNTRKVLNKLQSLQDNGIEIEDRTDSYSMIAIQGPYAKACLYTIINTELSLKKFCCMEFENDEYAFIIARTGYTGEDGYEIIVENKYIEKLWLKIFDSDRKVIPCGLGARDVLRLEAGYPLYGHELSENITPLHVGGERFIDFNKDFIGKKNLLNLKEKISRLLGSFVLNGKHIARQNDKIYYNGKLIGEITSGTYSFNFNKSIALGFVDKEYLDKKMDKVVIKHKKDSSEAIILTTSCLQYYRNLKN